MRLRVLARIALTIGFMGCSRSAPAPAGDAGSNQAGRPDPSANTGASTNSESAGATQKTEAKPVHWSGTYKTERGTFYVPDGPEYAGTKWRGDDSPEALGEGPIELTVDPQTGRVEGTLEGVLGASLVYGSITGDALTATIARKNIGDRGFSGTLWAKAPGAPAPQALTGTMRLSLPDAHLIRDANFTLKRKD